MLKNKLQGGEQKQEGNVMSFERGGRNYYRTRRDVENFRRKKDVVYYSERYQAYYIRRPSQKRGLLSRWF